LGLMALYVPRAMMAERDRGTEPRIIFYTKADCELCHEAKATLLSLQRELGFVLDEIDITTDPALYDTFRVEIPVGYLNGRKLFKYRVDSTQLRRQLHRRQGWRVARWFFPLQS
jgi:glutaredoxin